MKIANKIISINESNITKELNSIEDDFKKLSKLFNGAMNEYSNILDKLYRLKEDNDDKEVRLKLADIIKIIEGNSVHTLNKSLREYDIETYFKELRAKKGL